MSLRILQKNNLIWTFNVIENLSSCENSESKSSVRKLQKCNKSNA